MFRQRIFGEKAAWDPSRDGIGLSAGKSSQKS